MTSFKGIFPFKCFAISEWYVEILTKVVNKVIYIGCLVLFSSSLEAEHNDERIMKIN